MRIAHTSANLAVQIKEILDEFHLKNKVVLAVSENASNIVGAIKHELQLKHFGCFTHTINLILQDGFKTIKTLIEKVKTILTYFKRSCTASQKLKSEHKRMGQ